MKEIKHLKSEDIIKKSIFDKSNGQDILPSDFEIESENIENTVLPIQNSIEGKLKSKQSQ
ncbi:MAG: hypothetical protein J0M18_21015 [Ignavibacteria bacterium]|nr:hypothetical protein [Ignavibacteria bacterium]